MLGGVGRKTPFWILRCIINMRNPITYSELKIKNKFLNLKKTSQISTYLIYNGF